MPIQSPFWRDRAGRIGLWFGLFVVLVFCGEALGYAACELAGTQPPNAEAVIAMAGIAAVVGGLAAVLMSWLLLERFRQMSRDLVDLRLDADTRDEMERERADRLEQQRRLRHDLRGALSPALLTADRLITHQDPRVRRAGEIMVKSVDRAAALLADPDEPQASPPDDP